MYIEKIISNIEQGIMNNEVFDAQKLIALDNQLFTFHKSLANLLDFHALPEVYKE